jgi:anthranilate synthase component I
MSTISQESSMTTLPAQLLKRLQPPSLLSLVSDVETPVSVFQKISANSELAFLLESSEGDNRLARYSFTGADPLLVVEFLNGKAQVRAPGESEAQTIAVSNPTEVLSGLLKQCAAHVGDSLPELASIPFLGGLVGYMGYAATQYFEQIQPQQSDQLQVPDGIYGLYDSLIVFDHQYRRLHIISRRGRAYAEELATRIREAVPLSPLPASSLSTELPVFDNAQTNMPMDKFLGLVHKSQEYIREGQVFQIVVSQRFSLPVKASALDVYRVLQAINPSPYAYFLKLPGFSYIGSSPETFVRCVDGKVSLRAIAGTRPRGATQEQDALLATELKSNEKELAEHYMLVDLGRNDLGRVCEAGTVRVGKIAELTKYTHVMHLSTEISGRLSAGKTCFDAFTSCFPRGTVSGAPKIRAMQLLAELEPDRRGIYSGVVGYFDFQGNTDGAIAIRSALVKDGVAHVSAGAGIVLDSDPQAEYEETRNKAKSVMKAIVAANNIAGSAQ